MLTAFWESLGEQLSQKWIERLFGASFLFWAGGTALLVWRFGWQALWGWLSGLDGLLQGALLIGALLVLVGSDLLLETLDLPILRLLEGYWLRPPLRWLLNWRTQAQVKRYERLEERWQALKEREESLSPSERRELGRLEEEFRTHPADKSDFLPTRLGNLLRAAELLPKERFGLDAVTCWPYLWLLIPQDARRELLHARFALDRTAQSVVWGLLFFFWALVSPWAWLIGVLWLVWAYRHLYRLATIFADLQVAAFSLYRWELYRNQRWALPSDSESEVAYGESLSEFLGRGTSESVVQYQ